MIKRKFIEATTLEELEEKLNDFTSKFNPADVLDVQFFPSASGVNIEGTKRMNKSLHQNPAEETHYKETQTYNDRFICVVAYQETKEVNLNG